MKLYKNYCIRIDLEDDKEIRKLANLIEYGITLTEMNRGYYLTESTKAFGRELLNVLRCYDRNINEEGTNNEND